MKLEIAGLAVGKPVRCVLEHSDGTKNEIELLHTLNEGQLEWFRAGSALNRMRQLKEASKQ